MRGLALATAAAAALAAFALPGGAGADQRRVVAETQVTISKFLPLYHGRVKSDFRECKRRRKVILFRVRPGDDRKIDTDRANRRGKWRVQAPGNLAPGDRFYARVRNTSESSVGTGLSCMRDKSRTVPFVGD